MNLYSWTIARTDWEAAWSMWPETAVVMAERFDKVVFTEHKDCPGSNWDSGHLFTEEEHVSWRLLGASVRVVVAAGSEPAFTQSWGKAEQKSLKELPRRAHDVLIWGVKSTEDDPYWIELYIPHVMQAPDLHPESYANPQAAQAARRVLEVETFYAPDRGEAVYHRFKGLRYVATSPEGEGLVGFNS